MNIDSLGRIPPHSIPSEQSVIGSMLLDKDAIPDIAEMLKSEDFYREDHREIYDVIMDLFDKGEAIDLITVSDQLKQRGTLESVGGLEYLTNVATYVPTIANSHHYCKIVKEKSLLRTIIKGATNILEAGHNERPLQEIQGLSDDLLLKLDNGVYNEVISISKAVEEAKKNIDWRVQNKGGLPGIPSGLRFLDCKIGGLIPALLYLIAARPSMGKTALLLCMIIYICGYLKKPVLFFSLEMSRQQIINRLGCMVAEIENSKVRIGNLTPNEQVKMNKALDNISQWPLIIDDRPGLTLQEVNSKARKIAMVHKDLALICLDHLTEMAIDNKDDRQGITANVRGCKRLAKQLNVPFILLCQLNRGVEGRTNKRPILSDLRESGAIEEVADVINFIYRDNYYNPEADSREAELIVAKNRDGELGSIPLHWYGSITKFKTPVLPF